MTLPPAGGATLSADARAAGPAERCPAVHCVGLTKHYGDTAVLTGLDLHIDPGEVLGVLGPNGAGKTTLVSILSTLVRPDGGTARVAGSDVVTEAAAVRRRIALAGQYAAVDPELSGRENLVFFARLLGLRRRPAVHRAEELLSGFSLESAADRRAGTYSGGMRRRLDLAVALVADPAVLFLDEPTTGLDPRSRLGLWDVVRGQRDRGTAVLLTTQYLEEADVLADRVLVLDGGRAIAEGTSAALKERVGGVVCEVVPASVSAVPAMLDLLAPLSPQVVEAGSGTLRLSAPDGPATLTEVVRRLDAAGVEVADIGLRRPSLDDVFLTLTGHGVRAAEPDPQVPPEHPVTT